MDEPIHLYPIAPEFDKPIYGAQVIDIVELLYRIRKAMIDVVPNSIDPVFLLRLEGNLEGILSSGYGPTPTNANGRTHYFYGGDAIYLDRSLAYRPVACIVTIMNREFFLSRYECPLNEISTHMVVALNVIHGHEHDLSSSLPVRDK